MVQMEETRYSVYGINGLKNQSKRPHNIKNVKVNKELEKIILELRLNNRFGPMRIRSINEKV
jgi:hypothetical protein